MLKITLPNDLQQTSTTPALARASAAGFRRPQLFVLLAVVLFAALSLPTLSTFARYRGDESFYTDAAIRMVQTGDYLTPYYATGEARFNKPIFNYWVIVAFFKTLGINAFASRIGQLIFGVATLPIMYLLARAMGSSRNAAALAVAIMAVNIQLMNTSIRATTDVVQLFFLCVGMLGAARLLFRGSTSWRDRSLFGVGIAFGILTKGGMPALFLLFVAAFTFIHRKQLGHRVRAIVNERILLVAAAPFAIWIGLGVYHHGSKAALSFFNDQVASRLDEPVNPFMNLLLYGGSCLLEMMPFTALLPLMFIHQSGRLRRFLAARRLQVLFTVEWSLLVIAILIFGDTPRTRYMLLFYPLLAVMIGQLMTYLAHRRQTQRPMIRIIQCLLIGMTIAGFAEILFGLRVSSSIVIGGALITAAAGIALWLCRGKPLVYQLAALSLVLLAGYRCQDIFIRGILNPSPVPQMVDALATIQKSPIRLATLEDAYFAPQIRLGSHGTVQVDIAYATAATDDADREAVSEQDISASLKKLADPTYDAYLVPSAFKLPAEAESLHKIATVSNYRNWRFGDYLAVTFGRKSAAEVFDKRRQDYLILARPK